MEIPDHSPHGIYLVLNNPTQWTMQKVLYDPNVPPMSHLNAVFGCARCLDPGHLVLRFRPFCPGYVADYRADLPEVARLGVAQLVWMHPRIAFKTGR